MVSPDDRTEDAPGPRIDPDAATVSRDPRATIDPPDPDTAARQVLDRLAQSTRRSALGPGGALEIERTLGEGGMGIVRLARQVSVGRHVAVKTLRTANDAPADALRLLREAWTTGALEHPNVVPVYDVGLDERDAPVVVLKRIEGVPWSELIHDEAAVRARSGAQDALSWHLGILVQVCNAVHFAHTRRVIHRDIKPANVMVGSFGEVYLLDWGLAVGLDRDPTGRLPHVADATALAGTPGYMAPEMFGLGEVPSEKTDVYLLGAVLYEVLSGRAPHEGRNLLELLARATSDAPRVFPDDAPDELRDLCNRAMARAPGDRTPSAEAFRRALTDHLEHRGSALIAQTAEASRVRLHESLGNRASDRARVYDLYGECRFGFRHALRIWPANPAARHGLRDAVRAMVEYEIANDDARAAAVLLSEVDDPPADLHARVADAERASRLARERTERLVREHDTHTGRTPRTLAAVLMALFWSVLPWIGAPSLTRSEGLAALVAQPLSMLIVLLAVAWWQRRALLSNVIGRGLVRIAAVTLIAQIAMHLGAWQLGVPPVRAHILNLLLWGTSAGAFAALIDRRLAPGAVTYLACFALACARPEVRYAMFAASNLTLAANLLWMWRVPKTSRW